MAENKKLRFFLLAKRFLSWRSSVKEFPDGSCPEGPWKVFFTGVEPEYSYLAYRFKDVRTGISRVGFLGFGRDKTKCVLNSLKYMNSATDTRGTEGLDLFLSSAGF